MIKNWRWATLWVIGVVILSAGCAKNNDSKTNDSFAIAAKSIDPSAPDLRPNQEYDYLTSSKSIFEDKDGRYEVKAGIFTRKIKEKLIFSKFLDSSKNFLVIANSDSIFALNNDNTLYIVNKSKNLVSSKKVGFEDLTLSRSTEFVNIIFDKFYLFKNAIDRDVGLFFETSKKEFVIGPTTLPIESYKGYMLFESEPSLHSGDTTYEIYDVLEYTFKWQELTFNLPKKVKCGDISLEQNPRFKVSKNFIEISRLSPCGRVNFMFDWLADPPKLIGYHFSK